MGFLADLSIILFVAIWIHKSEAVTGNLEFWAVMGLFTVAAAIRGVKFTVKQERSS